MGAEYPESGVNKEKIMRSSEQDGYRGRYVEWGGIDYSSLIVGFAAGVIAVVGILSVTGCD